MSGETYNNNYEYNNAVRGTTPVMFSCALHRLLHHSILFRVYTPILCSILQDMNDMNFEEEIINTLYVPLDFAIVVQICHNKKMFKPTPVLSN